MIAFQTMATAKRNAGLTSVLPRATLNDEELVKPFLNHNYYGSSIISHYCLDNE